MKTQFVLSLLLFLSWNHIRAQGCNNFPTEVPMEMPTEIPAGVMPEIGAKELIPQTIFTEWQKEDVLELRLETDFEYLLNHKNEDVYQEAVVTMHPKSNKAYEATAKVKVRGKFRRRVCGFPPLKIKLTGSTLEDIPLRNYKTFKLVTHCENDQATKNTVLKEYLAYKLYEQVTPYSYRTQLVKITYVDQSGTHQSIKRFGFLLEDKDELEDRLEVSFGKYGFDAKQATEEDQIAAARMLLFQFMIGNSDFNLAANRNLKLAISKDDLQQIPIPYDFDLSGLVNPFYAFPNPDYDMQHIMDRVMLGEGIEPAVIEKVKTEFQAKREILLATVQEAVPLSKSEKKRVTEYLEVFFQLIDQPLDWEYRKVLPYF